MTVAVLAFAALASGQRQPPQQHNVLVLIADDTGVDAYGCYAAGTSPPPTPNIDALAGRGVRFTRAHAGPTCSPPRACIQTGRYPFRTGIGAALEPSALEGSTPPKHCCPKSGSPKRAVGRAA